MPKEGQFFLYFNKEELREIVDKYKTTDKNEIKDFIKQDALSRKEYADYKTEREVLQLENLKKRNINLDITNRIKLVHELKMSPSQALEVAQGRKELDIEPLSEQGLECPDCSWKTDATCDPMGQQDQMIRHLKESHNRLPSESEQERLLELVTK